MGNKIIERSVLEKSDNKMIIESQQNSLSNETFHSRKRSKKIVKYQSRTESNRKKSFINRWCSNSFAIALGSSESKVHRLEKQIEDLQNQLDRLERIETDPNSKYTKSSKKSSEWIRKGSIY
ncbi:hypothetical protein NH340_JMT09255 [Sarcoptes scabiei]|nr:hypothetical protein NH340_JMT09255 [Sarcoptes scabiei]